MKLIKSFLLVICLLIPLTLIGCENKNQPSLSTPELISVSNGVIVFAPVDNVEYYEILINELAVKVDARYNSNVSIVDNQINYNASKIFAFGKTYSVKIRAMAEEYKDSKYSNTLSYLHNEILTQPTNVKISANTLTWDIVNTANHYIVQVVHTTSGNSVSYQCETNTCSLLGAYAEFGAGEYGFAVKAVRTGVCAAETEFTTLQSVKHIVTLQNPTIENVFLDGGSLYMMANVDVNANAVDIVYNQNTKNVKLNGTDVNVNKVGNKYKINLSSLYGASTFAELKQYQFKIKAKFETTSVNFYNNSEYSEQFTYNQTIKLNSPNLTLIYSESNGGYFASWNSVNNAQGYVLTIVNGTEEVNIPLTETELSTLITQEFTGVKIKAIGIGNYLDSDYSAIVTK